MMRGAIATLGLWALGAGGIGCAQRTNAVEDAGDARHADSAAAVDDLVRLDGVGVTHAGDPCASSTVAGAGATVACNGVSLTIPPGALSSPVTVRAWADDTAVPQGYTRVSPHVAFEPAGQTLAAPATLAIDYAGSATPSLFWSRPDGTGYDRLPTTLQGGHAMATFTTLGDGFLATTTCGVACVPGCADPACSRVVDLSAGDEAVCALLADGRVSCWGRFSTDSYTLIPPTVVPGVQNAVQVAVGDSDACAVTADGRLFCWGVTGFSFAPDAGATPLPDGGFAFPYGGIEVGGLPPVAQVSLASSTGLGGGCVRDTAGGVWCWRNTFGTAPSPQSVPGLAGAVDVMGSLDGGCAIVTGGSVQCWGYVSAAADGDASVFHTQPVAIPGIANAVQLGAHGGGCARVADGSVHCWGYNAAGQLGDGTQNSSTSAVPVSGIASAVSVGSGGWASCAALSDGSAWCWGDDQYAELGDGVAHASCPNATPCSLVPVRVAGLDNAVRVTMGQFTACALGAEGAVSCWGIDRDGTAVPHGELVVHSTPVRVDL